VALKKASEIAYEHVTWIWDGYVPMGVLTLLVGDGGLGKSTLTAWLASRLSHGTLPGECQGRPATTLFLGEDEAGRVLVPRLVAAGADLDYIQAWEDDDADEPVLPSDEPRLAATVREHNVRAIVLDPLDDYILLRGDSHNARNVSQALKPWRKFAREYNLAVVGVHHVNKSHDGPASARLSGSLAYRNRARSLVVFGRDPDEPDERSNRRVMAPEKSNLGALAPALRWDRKDVPAKNHDGSPAVRRDGTPVLVPALRLVGECEHTAGAVLRTATKVDEEPHDDGSPSEAEEFLLQALNDGARRAGDIEREAKDELGLTKDMLRTARKRLGIKPRQYGKGWWWELPDSAGGPSGGPLQGIPSVPSVPSESQVGQAGQVGDVSESHVSPHLTEAPDYVPEPGDWPALPEPPEIPPLSDEEWEGVAREREDRGY
jgi:hypothetical protein